MGPEKRETISAGVLCMSKKASVDFKILVASLILAFVFSFYLEYADSYCVDGGYDSLTPDCTKLKFEWDTFDYIQKSIRYFIILWIGTEIQKYG